MQIEIHRVSCQACGKVFADATPQKVEGQHKRHIKDCKIIQMWEKFNKILDRELTYGELCQILGIKRRAAKAAERTGIECLACGWRGYADLDTPQGGLLKIYKGDQGWNWYGEYDDPEDEGIWVCPVCYVPEDGNIGTMV